MTTNGFMETEVSHLILLTFSSVFLSVTEENELEKLGEIKDEK